MNSKRIDQLMEQYFRGATTKAEEQELKGLFDCGAAGKSFPAERKMLNGINALQMQANLHRVEFRPKRQLVKLNIRSKGFRNTVLALSIAIIGVTSYSVGAYQYRKDMAKIRELSAQAEVINHAINKLNQGIQQSQGSLNNVSGEQKAAEGVATVQSIWEYPGKIYRTLTGNK